MRAVRPGVSACLLALTLTGPVAANGQEKAGKNSAPAAAEKAARAALARFDQGHPGWKVRMEALVGLVRAGPDAVPVLVDALQKGLPSTREFSAQVLAAVADPATRPALVRSLQDPEPGVRVHALRALRRLGRLELTDHPRQVLEKDSHWMLRHYLEIALLPDEAPNPAAMRKALMGYDLTRMDSARLGQVAPDFSLADAKGRTYRLSQFRGKKTVVLEFNTGDD
jgi:HEAT repeat protein